MKLELKRINLGSLIFSAFPLLIFALTLVKVLLSPPDIAEASLAQGIMQVILTVLVETLVMMVLSLVSAFVYNLFCSFGIKGVRFEIEDVEEVSNESEEAARQ